MVFNLFMVVWATWEDDSMVNVLFGIKVVALTTLVVVLIGCDSIIVFDLIQLIMTAEVAQNRYQNFRFGIGS